MKDIIIKSSSDLFLKLGFKSVTMDDIAHEMGVSKKTLYAHFKNKRKLVESVSFQMFENTQNRIDFIAQSARNPIEKLYLVKMYVMHQLKNEKRLPQYQLQKYYPRIYDTMQSMQYERMQFSIFESLVYGIEAGVFQNSIDVDFISRIYFIGMRGIQDHTSFPPEIYNSHYLMEKYLEYHLKAIVTEKGMALLKDLIKTNKSH